MNSRRVAAPLVKLAVFGAVTLVLTALLAQSLGSLRATGTRYRAQFSDVTAVLVGDDVRIAGVRVGQVTGISLVDSGGGRQTAELSFTVDSAVPLPAGVRATIRYRNLVGQRYLAMAEGAGGDGTRLAAGALIPLAQTAPALDLTTLFNGFRPLFTALSPQDVNSLAYEIVQVLQGEGGTVSDLLRHTASLSTTLADRDQVIGRVITNLNTVLSTLDSKRDQLSDTVAQLQQFVSGLAADRAAIGSAVASIGGLTGATGDLLRDARPALHADIGQLGALAGILNDNSDVIDATLAALPGRYQALAGTAGDGSWFNLFLCDFDGRITLPAVGAVNPAQVHSNSVRCAGGKAGGGR